MRFFHESIDFILNIVELNTCMRGLCLSLQCIELQIPMIIAFNLFDSTIQSLELQHLSIALGVPCQAIQATTGEGVALCMDTLLKIKQPAPLLSFYDSSIQHCIIQLQQVMPCSFFAGMQRLETGTFPFPITSIQHTYVNSIVQQDYDSIIAQNRYDFIQSLLFNFSFQTHHKTTIILDRWFLSKIGYFFLITLLTSIFLFSFGWLGPFFTHHLTHAFHYFITSFTLVFQPLIHPIVFSLLVHGIFRGCLSVLQFLPLILILFFFLSLLEESGYLARITILLDSPFKHMGCTGKSSVPLLLGLGCSVPAVLSTRILKSSHERNRILFLLPFISCTAKIPIYSYFASLFFPNYAISFLFFLYSLGLLLGLTFLSFSNRLYSQHNHSFLLEIPPYRWPRIKNTFQLLKEKNNEFIRKVFSLLLLLHLFLWFLQSFTLHFIYTQQQSESILYFFSHAISWIFEPLGFGDWRITSALISGLSAKEAILSTLSVLFQSTDSLVAYLSPSRAFSLLLFILFYSPCMATISITYQEAGLKSALFMVFFQCLWAWIISFLFYSVVRLFC